MHSQSSSCHSKHEGEWDHRAVNRRAAYYSTGHHWGDSWLAIVETIQLNLEELLILVTIKKHTCNANESLRQRKSEVHLSLGLTKSKFSLFILMQIAWLSWALFIPNNKKKFLKWFFLLSDITCLSYFLATPSNHS